MARKATPPVDQAELIRLYRKAIESGVPLQKLEAKVEKLLTRTTVSKKRESVEDQQKLTSIKKKLPLIVRFGAAMVPLTLLIIGLGLVGSAIAPIMGYYVETLPALKAKQLAAPIPQEQVLDVAPLIVAQAQTSGEEVSEDEADADFAPVILDEKLDYTNLSNWFDTADMPVVDGQAPDDSQPIEYTIDIPKVGVENAKVVVGGTDLNKSLIQYPGTALPGNPGSPVVFGHSILRQFYNPKETNPRRYTSIFSTIMTLKTGDKIYVTQDGVRYTYMVQEKTEVKPTDTYILAQRYDVKQLKLVTCVPEGTYLRRGVITAQLVKE